MDIALLSAFVIYFCVLAGIGIYFYHKSTSETDFILANRSVNYWVTAIATQSSDMSGWIFLGYPAAVYAGGVFEVWTAIGLIAGMFCTWHFIAPRLRTVTALHGSITLSSFFSHRFPKHSTSIALVGSMMAIIFLTFYIASSLVGLGLLFSSSLDCNYQTGTIVGLFFAVVYTLLGGFVAVAWCDFFQGLFLLAVIVFVPVCAYISVGGWDVVIHALRMKEVPLSLIPTWQDAGYSLSLAAGWGLGYFGQPHILTNFMAIDDVNNMKYAKRVGLTWQCITLTAATCIGLVGVAYVGPTMAENEDLFIVMAKGLLPSFLAGFALCGILAATLSTLDSHILIAGSIIAEDLYKKIFDTRASQRALITMSRLASIVVSLIGLVIAQYNIGSIYNLVNYAWAGLGSSFGPLVIMSLYGGKRVTGLGAIAGIVTGGIVSALWPYFNVIILPLVPGFASGLAAIVLVSAVSRWK